MSEEGLRRLPGPLDEATLERWLFWETWRERHGPKKCEERLLGAMRRKAQSERFKNIAFLATVTGRPYEEIRQNTARRMAMFCGMCPAMSCAMKRVAPE